MRYMISRALNSDNICLQMHVINFFFDPEDINKKANF